MVLNSSTVSGNSAQCAASGDGCLPFTGLGGGIDVNSGTLTLANSIVAGNAANGGNADIYGTYTDKGGNIANFGNPQLSPLQYSGVGATVPTMIPLPGSPAICAGQSTRIAPGITTDERAYPLQPSNGYCASTAVDAGAVQTHYTSVKFVQQPTGTEAMEDMSPAPTVEVLETDTLLTANNADAINGIPITLEYSGGSAEIVTPANLTETAAGGVATFSGLKPTTEGSGFTLSTSVLITTIGAGKTLSATSNSFTVYGPASELQVSVPSSVTAGLPFTVTVTALDSNGNTQLNFNDPLSLTINGQSTSLATITMSGGTGSTSLTFTSVGSTSLAVTDNLIPLFTGTSGLFSVLPGAASVLVVSGYPQTAHQGIPATGSMTAYDAYNNLDTNFNGGVTVTTSESSTPIPATLTNGVGTFSAAFASPGSGQSITASSVGLSSVSEIGITVSAVPTYVVTSTADSGGGSLRDALAQASASSAGTITFAPTVFRSSNSAAVNTITLSSGTLNIPSYTVISGATSGSGAALTNLVTISGGSTNNGFPLFTIASGVAEASIANLTITNSGASIAGGIQNAELADRPKLHHQRNGRRQRRGDLQQRRHLGDHRKHHLRQHTPGHYGGALFNPSGTATVAASTLSGNSASLGAGGILVTGGTVNVVDSTISHNFAGLYGPGIYNTHGTLTVANSIVSGNQQGTQASPGNYDDIGDQSGATTFSVGNLGGNLIGYFNANSATPPTAAPTLAALQIYGGPTETMRPLPPVLAAICARPVG